MVIPDKLLIKGKFRFLLYDSCGHIFHHTYKRARAHTRSYPTFSNTCPFDGLHIKAILIIFMDTYTFFPPIYCAPIPYYWFYVYSLI